MTEQQIQQMEQGAAPEQDPAMEELPEEPMPE